jgi:hypothetical protein
MSKISTYEVAPVPKLADKLIGTSVGGEIEDVTYNFTLQELLDVFLPVIPANNLQGVLDYGNTATQDINLFGTITTTNLDVTDTANLFITYLNEETHIVGGLFDSEDSIGLAGQVLTSTGEFVEWVTLPPIFTPNLQQVLDIGNTSDTGIILDAGLEALDVDTDTATINTNITIDGTITDEDASVGTAGTVLSSTVTGVKWVALPVYSATSPLLFNSATGVFSIQQATNSQSGYLSSSDWITFDGKQNAGNYITALTGEATASGPGSASVTLGNAAVIGKVLTGFNPTAGTINASDSILTAFGKTQSQINALVGGVLYKGTWNASANLPVLTSSVGVQGNYYVVNVAGNTNLNGITDWKVGDWAIFSESVWQKVDNTESVSSVNGFTGAVELTTDNIPEGTTNLYFLNSRARLALSFLPGSGAYDNTSGAITIPTDNNQILNGAGYITLSSLSATAPLTYNNLTGAFGIPKATTLVDGYLSATDWTTFNGKQNYLGGTGLVKSTAGTISYITDNSTNWNTAYDRSIVSAAVTGTTTKTLTLNEQDGGTITASWTDLDTGLTSVGVSMPSAFSVANSPLTANGTIAVTGAGTSLQYIDGTGALQTFPGLTGFVPYTGATANVDLGTFGLISDYLRLNITPSSIPTTVGTMSWNDSDGTMDIRLKGGNVTLQVGEETVVRVVNKSGVDLLEANYQVVRVRNEAEGGAQGQRLAVVLARANTKVNHTGLLGIVTETINSNQEGFVTNFGIVRDIDTTGDLQGETWVDGDVLWLSETTAGALTNIEPTTHPIQIGYVIYAHANNGKIFVYLQEGVDELDELHDVSITSVANNQGLFYDSATSLWKNKSIATVLGYTPANAATTISTTAPLQGGGDLSANRTFSITQSGTATDGYLSSTDWNTFNNKQPSGSYVPTSRQLTINGTAYDLSADRVWSVGTVTSVAALTLGTTGTDLSSSVATGTTTPVITLNVPTASAANRGALSAADWSTFNTKVGSVTASSPLASSGGSTPNITIQQSSGSQDGYLSSTDWTTFNNKQAAGNYITSLTGEATATGPGAAAVTLNNASVTGKILTGVNITGGTVQATDTMLTAFGKLQNQINGLIGSTIYQGTWNAATNTPALASGVGVRGYYYIVSVAGTTNLDGITDWFVGDWAIFDGTAWQQVDNTDAVVSVNGQTGAVSLTTDNISEGSTNLYYLDSRARGALSFTAGSGAYNSTTGVITIPTNTNQLTNGASFITLASLSGTAPIQYNNTTGAISITQSGTAANGFLSSTDWNTFNNKAPSVVGGYLPLSGGTLTGALGGTSADFSSDVQSSSFFRSNTPATNSITIGVSANTNYGYIGNNNNWGIRTGISGDFNIDVNNSATPINAFKISQNGAATFSSSVFISESANILRFGNALRWGFQRPTSDNRFVSFYRTLHTTGVPVWTVDGDNGYVGINTITPLAFLDVAMVSNGTRRLLVNYADSIVTIKSSNDVNNGENLRLIGDNIFFNSGSSGSGTQRLTITSAGNVGIGVTPIATSGVTELALGSSNTNPRFSGIRDGVEAFYLYSDSVSTLLNERRNLELKLGTNNTTRLTISNTGAATFTSSVTAINAFFNASNGFGLAGRNAADTQYRNLIILNSGNQIEIGRDTDISQIRIGTASANDALTIASNGAATFSSSVTANYGGIFIIPGESPASGNVALIARTSNGVNDIFRWFDGATQLGVFKNNGNVLIGTSTDAGFKLDVAGQTRIYQPATNSVNYLNIYNNRTRNAAVLTETTNGGFYAGTSIGTDTFNYQIYDGNAGSARLTIASNGAASFSGSITSNAGDIFATDGTRINFFGVGTGANVGYVGTTTNHALAILTNNSEKARFTASGEMLIGTPTGVSGGGRLQVNGNVNINGVFQINGVTIGGGGGSGVTGSGTTDFLTKWTGGTTLGNSSISDNGSTVSVRSGVIFQVNRADNGRALQLYTTNDECVVNSWEASSEPLHIRSMGAGGRIQFFTAGAERMRIISSGNVGIGITAPSDFIDAGLGLAIISTSGRTGLSLGSTQGTANEVLGRLSFTNTNSTNIGNKRLAYISGIRGTTNNSAYLEFGTANDALGTQRMVIAQTGNVLINTSTDAGYKLDVNGGTRIQGNLRLDGSSVDSPLLTMVGVTNTIISMGDLTGATTDIGYMQINNGGTPLIYFSGGASSFSYFDTGGLLIGTITSAGAGYKLQVNGSMLMTYANFFNFRGSSPAGDVLVDNSGSTLRITGNVTVAGSVTATGGFFDTSDSRLKIIITDNHIAKGIEKVAAKFYVKNGKRELGYFAQDLQEILPSAVGEGTDGFLTLSYSQVHTAKIALIEDEVTILKNRVSDLESKLLKYEA